MRLFPMWAAATLGVASALLAGCGGLATPPATDGAPARQAQVIHHSVSPCPCLYVANAEDLVTVYPVGAAGNARPVQAISGGMTGLDNPRGIAVDASGNIYVTNQSASITVYSSGANGNVAPLQTISGSNTLLCGRSIGIAINSLNGEIYVANTPDGAGCPASINVYAAGANGNVAPIGVIEGSKTKLDFPFGVALDSTGNIYISDSGNRLYVYAAGSSGNVAPARTIKGSLTGLKQPKMLALDSSSNIYVANEQTKSIAVYAAGANGNVAPMQLIKGSATKIRKPGLLGVGVDGARNIYAAAYDESYITAYASGATGNVAPIRTIKGRKTGLGGPDAIAVH